jgi:hypothetical protein
MNIAPVHIDALKAFGYTEAEARFLYLVATHSGYFVARQFLAFANARWGERTTSFWNKLHTKKHARSERFPKSGVVHHLFSRRLYHQIDRENIRNRREHEFEYIQRRIGILDFVLSNLRYRYLETEPEMVNFFCDQLKTPRHFLPSKIYYGQRMSQPTLRYHKTYGTRSKNSWAFSVWPVVLLCIGARRLDASRGTFVRSLVPLEQTKEESSCSSERDISSGIYVENLVRASRMFGFGSETRQARMEAARG